MSVLLMSPNRPQRSEDGWGSPQGSGKVVARPCIRGDSAGTGAARRFVA